MATHFSLPSPSLTFVNRVACAVTISVLRHCHSEAGAAEADEHNADRTQNLGRSSLALGSLLVLQARLFLSLALRNTSHGHSHFS